MMTFTIFIYFCFYFCVIKVPMSKLIILVAAKWREFSDTEGNDTPPEEEESTAIFSSRLRSSRRAASNREEPELPDSKRR